MKQLNEMSDLELGKVSGQLYQELMRIQSNILAVSQEMERREKLNEIAEKKDDKK